VTTGEGEVGIDTLPVVTIEDLGIVAPGEGELGKAAAEIG
jgi:hypothetical protein